MAFFIEQSASTINGNNQWTCRFAVAPTTIAPTPQAAITKVIAPVVMAPHKPASRAGFSYGVMKARAIMARDAAKEEAAFTAFFKDNAERLSKPKRVVRGKRGSLWLKPYTEAQTRAYNARIEKRAAEERAFQSAPSFDIFTISIGGGAKPSTEPAEIARPLNKTPSMKISRKKPERLSLNTQALENLTTCVSKIQRTKRCCMEFIGRRTTKGRFVDWQHMPVLRVEVAHLEGSRNKVDCRIDPVMASFVARAANTCARRRVINTHELQPGTSGFVLNPSKIRGNIGRHSGGMFIVRGLYNKVIFDARSKVNDDIRFGMTQFSETGHKFWLGFCNSYVKHRTIPETHTCESSLDVGECGEVAALVCQALFPSGKITCTSCVDTLSTSGYDQTRDRTLRGIEKFLSVVQEEHPQFTHVVNTLAFLKTQLNESVINYSTFSEIAQILRDRTEAPASHLITLNEVLAKGRTATDEELNTAGKALLEVARYHKNRTENIQKGVLTHFRNKISAKSRVNTSLMCDNQLDKNGNFVWGERGYHAKRFFNNYFEIVDNSQGYGKHIIRPCPNGARKLAIGNLIVSTNFETLREQMKGEMIEAHPVSQQCISKRGENYVYPCCCVTLDDGKPLLSEVIMPTKNHLVIGNSGDSKYVDLPTNTSAQMYIAKPGYCYINIFLAMLVNVNEAEAKGFTKMVRDVIVDKLGAWPSLLDVATACYLLTVFHPETKNAELPRILIDHDTKTTHVVDSYGSMTTGYHILKAGTISQLIQFASTSLESEIKHYSVGGLVDPKACHFDSLKLLAKGIYRPKLMQQILEDEPYLILMGVVSPGILMAMYNSGTFERAVKLWINQDMRVVDIAIMLTTLTEKVSLAKTLDEQLRIIDMSASSLLDATFKGFMPYMSYQMGISTLQAIAARTDTDKTLLDIGFNMLRGKSHHLVEKNYISLLDTSWSELGCVEKLRAIYVSHRWLGWCKGFVAPAKLADMGGRYSTSSLALLKREALRIKNAATWIGTCATAKVTAFKRKMICRAICMTRLLIPDFFRFINILVVISLIMTICVSGNEMLAIHRKAKQAQAELEFKRKWKSLQMYFMQLERKLGNNPTVLEFVEYLEHQDPTLVEMAKKLEYVADVPVIHQVKRRSEARLEQVVAFTALVMMLFDSERSDCVHKILTKLKSLVGTIDEDVKHQNLDDIVNTLEEKNMTVDFEVSTDEILSVNARERTFEQWWGEQLQNNHTIPHYRTEGHFIEFTRETAESVANEIAHGSWKDILLRGAVGSGKSTGLPFHLSAKGSVLVLEPTRPLAENVCKQLRSAPFHVSPTLRMRGLSTFGSTPITVMTSGYALHFFANNPQQLEQYKFTLMDECHVLDSSAMAFRCLLSEYSYSGTIVKVSATPPGREVEFKTQHPVKLVTEESLSFQQFVSSQGSGVSCDILQYGVNVLVYVSSYNEVDSLSKLLQERKFMVTKVDGRTMKIGNVEIITSGSKSKPHFIVATNIIENGVTLDVDVVVDFGLKVTPELDLDNRLVRYAKHSISYGERVQRLGRVGRNKPGTALRIGMTEKGLVQIPQMLATEAAFLCFTYGLPVMTQNVSVSLLANCTVPQARTMQNFELSPFYTYHLVRFDGTMHAHIHKLLTPFKLRDSEVILNKRAIPNRGVASWLSVREYERIGGRIAGEPDTRIPFLIQGIPDKLHRDIWEAVELFKGDAGFGRLTSMSACKIAYTLQTDVFSIPRTVKIIDSLIASEMQKQAHFRSISGNTCSSSSFSLASISNAIRAKYAKDHTIENISILQSAKAQLLEYKNLSVDPSVQDSLREFGALECVQFQSDLDMAKHLKLKGRWDKGLITRDILIMAGVAIGGIWMVYEAFSEKFKEVVVYQGYNKRQRQKLKFRAARDNKREREVYGDDATIGDYFGNAYTAKGKTKGTTRAMGRKTRKFINMYGYDPADYSFVRFVDPLTGCTLDEAIYTDIHLVQEHFTTIRQELMDDDILDPQQINARPGITAFYVKNLTSPALKVDLTPHNPLRVCNKAVTIAGFPEREFELRQTGQPIVVAPTEIPKEQVEFKEEVGHEGKSLLGGLRDYNPIATSICKLTNESDGHCETLFGVGFGSMIITNQHLFRRNNGTLTIRSHHGEFVVKNSTQLQLRPCAGRDILIIRTPKDFPPFPQKLQFREPKPNERICMIGSNFQNKSVSSTLSEVCTTYPVENSHFWKHWISTKDGYCGLPIVSTRDGCILGIHSLTNFSQTNNFFASLPANFSNEYLKKDEDVLWTKHWKYNTNNICWGALKIHDSQPEEPFKISKLISDLGAQEVYAQGSNATWMMDELKGNLKAVAHCPSQLVTKHVVKGKCALFDMYLQLHDEEREYFKPMMGEYQKSRLNREAYIKDIMKYSSPITVGEVNTDIFEAALEATKDLLRQRGFKQCVYVTDSDEIFAALNMKAAVGALYSGKKRDYFKDYTDGQKDCILRESCRRLYEGKLGVWNGSLKAELRPKAKVEANKTRTFTAAPLDTLLGGKTCVDDFNNQFYELNIKCPWSVGMTKFHGGWNELLTALPDGWLYCDADGSQFDSSLSPYLINAVLQLRLSFMESWDVGEQMLSNLYTEIIYTPISTPDGTIVKKFKGNNSGQPSTVVDNTLMVIMAVLYTLLSLGIEVEEIDNVCRYFVNGDDLLLAVAPTFEWLYDRFEEFFSQLGLNYKFDSRTRDRKELWFMSHRGIEKDGLLIPKLEEERIVSILEWDRATEPAHRMEAICAAIIESWGYDKLTHEIRKFYSWLLEQAPFRELAQEGRAPYIAETALRRLYTNIEAHESELLEYYQAFENEELYDDDFEVSYQSGEARLDAGESSRRKEADKEKETPEQPIVRSGKDKDVDVGTNGTFPVPRLKSMATKLSLPKVGNRIVLNLTHLLHYTPEQVDLSNTRATHTQFQAWYEGVKADYGVTDDEMSILLNGLMVWCIENGTSPNINGMWVMMDGSTQVEYPIKPLIDHAIPTFRQVMAHFSNVAEAYIEKRNFERPYMPRYGLQRNLTDMSLARYAFDFYEMTSKTPIRAREAHIQMKAAALRNANTRMFGLDGNVGVKDEDTERHTADDVNRNMHTLLGMRGV
ncbi:polyprotein [Polygonatum kingianum virus 5]|nr:polyprotein [Polygonatum kingianum virus 5]